MTFFFFLPSSVLRLRKLAFSIKSVIIKPMIFTGYFFFFPSLFHMFRDMIYMICMGGLRLGGSCLCIFNWMFTISSLSFMVPNTVADIISHLNRLNRLHSATNWRFFKCSSPHPLSPWQCCCGFSLRGSHHCSAVMTTAQMNVCYISFSLQLKLIWVRLGIDDNLLMSKDVFDVTV